MQTPTGKPMLFLVKKPQWLDFNKASKNLSIFSNGKHNAMLVRFENNEYCIRIGKYMFPLKEVKVRKKIYLAEKEKILCVENKHFISKISGYD